MINLIIAIFILSGLIIQLTILQAISFSGIRPDILLILAIFFNIYFSLRRGLVIGSICGLLKDIFSLEVFGLNLFSFIICILIIQRFKKYFYKENYPTIISIVFLISLANSVIYCLFRIFVFDLAFSAPFLLIIFLESIYTALVSALIFIPFKKCVLELSI